MKRFLNYIVRWGLVLIWMGVIFMFSSQLGPQSSSTSEQVIRTVAPIVNPEFSNLPAQQQEHIVSEWQFTVRKLAHFGVYFVLCLLVYSALSLYRLRPLPRAAIALGISVAYAALDEFHQLFVDGRSGQLSDVLIDGAGALAAVAVILSIGAILRRRHRSKS